MHFPDLSEMGQHYAAEEGTEGVRRGVLDSYAASLRNLQMQQAAARVAAAPPTATGSVRDRVNFFSSDLTKRREDAERLVRDLQTKIEAVKAKLARQGGTLLPNGDIDWIQTTRQVVYDNTAAAQGLTQLHSSGGFLYTNAAHTTKFDTTTMVTAFGGRGWAIYVMSETGNVHASPHSVGHRHHSSLLGGANVAGAGEMRVLQGKLVHISNKSGHYAPAAAHFVQVLYVLRKRGVSLFNTKITFKTAAGQQDFNSVDAFMASLVATGMETDFDFGKMMSYLNKLPYAQFVLLATAKGWRWGTPMDFAVGGPAAGGKGVVKIADGTQVPHKDVRKWLKGLGYTLLPAVQSGVGR